MAYRLAGSLVRYRAECNGRWPGRDKASDGWIGDPAHRRRKSDHNPNPRGVVRAYDLDAGPGANRDVGQWVADWLVHLARDMNHVPLRGPNAYVIWNRRIASARSGWAWRRYTGANPHTSHVHVSVSSDPAEYDNPISWAIGSAPTGGGGRAPVAPVAGAHSLARGARGEDVRRLQRVLNGWYPHLRLAVDGQFGAATEAGVKELQRRAGLAVDGVVGPATRAILNL